MILLDANVLVFAFRKDANQHREFRDWPKSSLLNEPAIGLSELVLSSVIRIATHPGIFAKLSTFDEVLGFCDHLLRQPNVARVSPGDRHWSIFAGMAREARVRGNLVTDAYFAALAIENGAEWITTDRDFARFKSLRWRHPLS
ncbi:MAG: type II toxin-antitoxin system VapC family toxin [Candidatus Hydrogenedentes bacterium]|nr:type II toxin-antitoxin system VapC family toxin [Candidatus Hydrogenedentota bacterium]